MRLRSEMNERNLSFVNLSFVLPGLDPGIHEAARRNTTLQTAFADTHHGLPGQARQRRTRGSVRYGEIGASYVGNALSASARTERQCHVGGFGLPRAGFDLPHDLD